MQKSGVVEARYHVSEVDGDRKNPLKVFFVAISMICIVAGIFFRIWELQRFPGINGDEAWYGVWIYDVLEGVDRDWVTPSKLPLNPFYMLPLTLILSMVSEPSFILLRLPAVISGILLLVLAYPLMKKVLKKDETLNLVVLLSALPVLIGFSRIGWDASQTPLITLICLYYAFKLKPVWTKETIITSLCLFLSLGAAAWIHPTNVFLAPLLIAPVIGLSFAEGWRPGKKFWIVLPFLLLVGVGTIFLVNGLLPNPVLDFKIVGSHLIDPSSFVDALRGGVRLISGATFFEDVVGPMSGGLKLIFEGVLSLIVLPLLCFGGYKLYLNKEGQALGFLVGLLVTFVVFYLITGSRALVIPGFERYCIFLVVPSCLALILLWGQFKSHIVTLPIVSLLMMVVFYLNFFQVYQDTGGRPNVHVTYKSGKSEPKKAVLDFMKFQVPEGQVLVGTEFWWSYWPLRFLTAKDKRFEIVEIKNKFRNREDVDKFNKNFGVFDKKSLSKDYKASYMVGFAGATFEKIAKQRSNHWREQGQSKDMKGEPILYLWRRDINQMELEKLLKGGLNSIPLKSAEPPSKPEKP